MGRDKDMGQHRNEAPSSVSVIMTGLATIAAGMTTVSVAAAATDGNDLKGATLGILLTVLLTAQTIHRVAGWAIDAKDRRDEAWAQRERAETPVESDEDRAGYAFGTGGWVDPGSAMIVDTTRSWTLEDQAEASRIWAPYGQRMSGDAGLYGRAAWLTDETQPIVSGLFVTEAHRSAWTDWPTQVIGV